MGRYGGESAVVGVKTRARAASIMAAKTSSSSSSSKKIKKVSKTSSYDDSNRTTCSYQLRNRRRNLSVPETFAVRRDFTAEEPVVKVKEEEVANCSSSEVITTTAITVNSEFPPSCFSSNINDEENDQSSSPNDVVMDRCVADPEVNNIGEASSRNIDCHTKRTTEENETSLREEEARESNGQDYCSPKLPDVKSTVLIKVMPSDAEIEEFFAAAEKDLQKRFIDKYNFDIVKDVPLEGRYEWVSMKP